MSKYAAMPLSDYVKACNNIRNKTYSADNIKSGDLSKKIDEVFNKGYENGFDEGKTNGEEALLDAMWEALQGGGEKTEYDSTFFNNTNFTKKTFKPKYDMKFTDAYGLFDNCPLDKNLLLAEGQVNMKELEEERGMKFDFSECTNFTKTFSSGLFSELNVIDVSKATNLILAFYGGYLGGREMLGLRRIERLICSEASAFVANTFGYQEYLAYIGFEGVVGKSINLKDCPLIVESINKLFACLKDYSAIGGTYTVTLKADRENMLTAEEKAVATNKGWTLVWS